MTWAHQLKPGRLAAYWALLFVPLYIASFFLYSLWIVSPLPILFLSLQLLPPLLYFLFSWLYFRKVSWNTWTTRLAVGVLWVALTLLASALLILPVYGYDWRYAINVGVLQAQLLNVAAVLVGGFVATPKKTLTP